MFVSVFDQVEHLVGKGEDASYQHFLLTQYFQEPSSLRVVENLYFVERNSANARSCTHVFEIPLWCKV